jgi:quinoprotein glucose dehydrogenase
VGESGEEDRVERVSLLVLTAAFFCATSAFAQRGAPNGEWPTYGGDAGSTKYAPLDQINRENVKRLRVVWRWESPDNAVVSVNRAKLPMMPAAFKSTPIMMNGVLYIKTSLSQATAIDAATGKTLWVFDPGAWEGERPANTGFNSRGVAYWSDGGTSRIFLPTGDAYLWSIDAKTGRPVADFGADGAIDATAGLRRPVPRHEIQLMSAPLVVGDVVVIGSVVSDGPRYQLAPPGDVRGFDVRTGRELWQFHTIPQEGELGNQTWENGSWKYTGAANAWGLLSADPELGYVYIPTGTPTNDYYGGHRLGNNLFAESLVCLDAVTGKVVWHYQFVHHGLWDYDATAAPLLVDLTVDGRPIKAVAVVTKQAFTYVFDRVTGRPVWPIEERPVPQSTVPGEKTSPTQPHPTKPPAFDRQGVTIDDLIDFTPELRKEAIEILQGYVYGPLFEPPSLEGDGKLGTILMPGVGGGANWHGAAVDPETGWLYVPSRTAPSVIQLAPPDPSQSDFRYRRGGNRAMQGPRGLPLFKPPYMRLTAIDLTAGSHAWTIPLGDGPRQRVIEMGIPDPGPLGGGAYTGPLLTKTLLFLGLRGNDVPDLNLGGTAAPRPPISTPPVLRAIDKATGATVHSVELNVPPTGTPMTYLLNGKQYIVLAYGMANDSGLIALAVE